MTREQLLAVRNGLLAEAEDLLDLADAEHRALTGAEQAKYDAAVARVEDLNAKIEAHGGTGEPVPRPQPSNALPDDDIDAPRGRRIALPVSGPLQCFKNTQAGRESAYRAGRWFAATLLQHGPSAQWCAQNGLALQVHAALGGGANPGGGALVPEEMERQIIELMDTHGLFRQFADVTPMGSDTRVVPRRVGGLTAHFVGENTEGTESDASWDNVTLVAKKLMVLTRMSSEISEDAIIDLGDKMSAEISLAITEKEDSCGFLGTGAATFGGITGVFVRALQAANPLAKVEATATHDTFAELDAEDLLKMLAALPKYAKRGAAWYCNPAARAMVFDAITMSAGGTDSSQLAALQTERFLGYPIRESELLPGDLSATYNGLAMLGFGNLAQCAKYGLRRGINVALSGHRWFELDQVGIRGTSRFDINVHSLGDATKKPPFAVLVGKT